MKTISASEAKQNRVPNQKWIDLFLKQAFKEIQEGYEKGHTSAYILTPKEIYEELRYEWSWFEEYRYLKKEQIIIANTLIDLGYTLSGTSFGQCGTGRALVISWGKIERAKDYEQAVLNQLTD